MSNTLLFIIVAAAILMLVIGGAVTIAITLYRANRLIVSEVVLPHLEKVMGARLPSQPVELINRKEEMRFTFEGNEYSAFKGDTIASALAASGIKIFSRSFKYHRPRGLLCCSGHCPNCLVQIGDEPNVRACRQRVAPDMIVKPQNVTPTLMWDLLAPIMRFLSPFMPVGFYYKTLYRPKWIWKVAEPLLRAAGGLGKASHSESPEDTFDKQYLHGDVVVIGGGPTGISAALSAAGSDAKVLLIDENDQLGGYLRIKAEAKDVVDELCASVYAHPNIQTLTETTVTGCYDHNWLAATHGDRLYKIRADKVVLATGVVERPLVFDNNDLPGVMLGSAAQYLLHLYAVRPGRRAVVVTANDDGWDVAADLHAAGIEVVALADERERAACSSAKMESLEAELPVFWRHIVTSAHGNTAVNAATIAPLESDGSLTTRRTRLECDLLLVSIGWTPNTGLAYQAGVEFGYDEDRAELMAQNLPDDFIIAGRAAGTHMLEHQITEGALAGRRMASAAGYGDAPTTSEWTFVQEEKKREVTRSSQRTIVKGSSKRFLCYCEDVTDKDLTTAVAEGYDSIELLKRYSTISMGPCQGKMCSMNAVHLCAHANTSTVDETGSTTTRPPMTPISLGALAGQNMEPVRITPIHDWHLGQGAKMMVAGLWLRPEHYGNPTEEVRAVRERVGVIDVSTLGKYKLTGPHVPNILEKVYTNRWRQLAVGQVRYGVMCNAEGIVIDDGVTARFDEREWYMTTTSGGAGAIYEWIQWWMQSGWGDGVQLINRSDDFAAFNLAGPKARTLLKELTDIQLDNKEFPYMHVRSGAVAGVPCRLLRIGFTGELSYEIHCPASYGLHLWEQLLQAGEQFGIMPFGVEAQRVLRLEKGHLIIGQDTDALSNPIASNLEWAVKLEKDDFLGQRSLLRVAENGLKQRLIGFKVNETGPTPEEGLQIVSINSNSKQRKIIGWVSSCRFSPTLNQVIGLCWLPTEIADVDGAEFIIWREERALTAHVHHGAFYDSNGARLRS